MRLTRFTEYGLRVLMYTASAPAGRTTIAEIAQAFSISQSHLMKVVHQLGRMGVLANVRGRNGGIRLAADPSAINVGSVVRVTEGTGRPAECFESDGRPCRIAGVCRLERALQKALDAFYWTLDQVTLADLVSNKEVLVAGLHRRPKPQAAVAACQ